MGHTVTLPRFYAKLRYNLRFTISVQVMIIAFVIVVFGGKVISSIVASSWMGRARTFVMAGCAAVAVAARVTGAELYWVARTGLTEHAALAVLRRMVR